MKKDQNGRMWISPTHAIYYAECAGLTQINRADIGSEQVNKNGTQS
jgi:hypothetical protein